jgi:putative tryptophan/tyrosine transport system substrate-binding protein
MIRRKFITLIGGAAAWPVAARAQQAKMPVIGFFGTGSPGSSADMLAAFRDSLKNGGYIEGHNITIESRWADGDFDHLVALAQELTKLKPVVIVASTTAATLATKRETSTIPIVCVNCTDPVGMALVTSEAHPGTNVTGSLTRVEGLTGKQMALATEAIPGLSKVGLLINVSNPSNLVQRSEAESAAAKLAITLVGAEVRGPKEIYAALQVLARENVGMVLLLQDSMFLSERKRIALLAAAAKLPTMFSFREMVEDGGLISYGIDLREDYRAAALYVERILKGEKPADLPMQFQTMLSLTINLIAAKALGLEIPPTLLVRAEEVIE